MKYHILNNATPLDIDVIVKVSSSHALCAIPPGQNKDTEVIRHNELDTLTTLSLGVSGDLPTDPVVDMVSLGTVRGMLTHTTMTLYQNPLDNLIYLVPDLRRVCSSLELLPTHISLEVICVGGNTTSALPIIHTLIAPAPVTGITGVTPTLPAGTPATPAYTAGLDIRNDGYTRDTQSVTTRGSIAGDSIRTRRSLLTMVSLGTVLSLGASGTKLPASVVVQNSMLSHSIQSVGHKVVPDDHELVFFLNMF